MYYDYYRPKPAPAREPVTGPPAVEPDPQSTVGNAALLEWTLREQVEDDGQGSSVTDGTSVLLDGSGVTVRSTSELEANDGTSTSHESNVGGGVGWDDDGATVTLRGGESTTDTDAFGNATETGTSGSVTLTGDGFQGSYTSGSKTTDADGTVHDRTRTGTVILEEDQVGFGYGQNGRYGEVTYNPEDGTIGADGRVTTSNGVEVGVGVELRDHTETGTGTTSFTETPVLEALLGSDVAYGHGTQTRSWAVDASVGAKGVEISGGMNGGSAITAFEALPASWDTLTEEERNAWLATQAARAEQVHGIGDLDPRQLTAGQGVEFRSWNGWHAHAGVTYGMLSAEAGGGRATAYDLGLSFDGDSYHVALRTEHDVDSTVGLGIVGQNLAIGTHGGQNEQFAFEVDAQDPQAMAALDAFLETGLLPGADRIPGEPATAAATTFHEARADIDRLDAEMAVLRAQIGAGAGPADPVLVERLQALTIEYGDAQAALAESRDTLNTLWGQTFSPSNQPPIPGLTVTQAVEEEESGSTLSVAGTEIAANEQVVGHEEEVVPAGVVDRYYLNSSATFLGHEVSRYGVDAYAGDTPLALRASAESDLSVQDNWAALQHVDDNPIPDWVVAQGADAGNHTVGEWLDGSDEAWEGLRGETRLEIDQATLDRYAAFANDPNNPYAQDLWAGFADRTSAFWTEDGTWWGPEMQAAAEAYGLVGHWDLARDGMIGSAYAESELARQQGGSDATWTVLPDTNLPREEVARMFAGVRSAEDFRHLPPAWQQVYIDTIVATSLESSPYDAMAAIALIPDPEVRAQEMRELFIKMQTDGQVIGSGASEAYSSYNDPVLDFALWTQQFAGADPAVYADLQGALSFRVTSDSIALLEGQDAAGLGTTLKDAASRTVTDFWGTQHRDPDEGKVFDAVMAAWNQGGEGGVAALVQASGLTPAQIVEAMADDPRQAWVMEMLVDAGQGQALAADAATVLGSAGSIERYAQLVEVLEAGGGTNVQSAALAPSLDLGLLQQLATQDPAELGAALRAQEQVHSGLLSAWDPNTGYMSAALATVHGDPAASAALIRGYLDAAAADGWGGDQVTNLLDAMDGHGSVQQLGLALDVLRDAGYGAEVDAWLADR